MPLTRCVKATCVEGVCVLAQKEVPLGNPDVLVCSVGTEIFFEVGSANPEANKQWGEELDQGWNRAKAMQITESFPDLKSQVHYWEPAQNNSNWPCNCRGGAGHADNSMAMIRIQVDRQMN